MTIVKRIGRPVLAAWLTLAAAPAFAADDLPTPAWLKDPPTTFPQGKPAYGQTGRPSYTGHAEAYLVKA